MEFSINKSVLSDAIKMVRGAVATTATNDILKSILIEVEDNGIYSTAMNGEITIRHFVPSTTDNENEQVHIVKAGRIAFEFKYFEQIVNKLKGKEIKVSIDKDRPAIISSGKQKFNLSWRDAEDFPRCPIMSEGTSLQLNSDFLKSSIKSTLISCATSEVRPILCGVLWQYSEGNLQFIATDSHRLSKKIMQQENCEPFEGVIGGKNLEKLEKILPADEIVSVQMSENQMCVEFGQTTFYSRLLEGSFPDTTRIIPQNFNTVLKIKTKDFLDGIDACAIFKEGTNTVVRLTYKNGIPEITLTAKDQSGAAEQFIDVEGQGADVSIAFNAKYGLDALRTLESNEYTIIGLTSNMSPFVMRGDSDKTLIQLILPVRTQQ